MKWEDVEIGRPFTVNKSPKGRQDSSRFMKEDDRGRLVIYLHGKNFWVGMENRMHNSVVRSAEKYGVTYLKEGEEL